MPAQTFLGVLAAFEYEAALVRRRMRPRCQQMTPVGRLWQGALCGHHVVLLRCGMGPERAGRATIWLAHTYPLRGMISIGFAGGLQPALHTGDAVLAQQIRSCCTSPAATAPSFTEPITPAPSLLYLADQAAASAAFTLHRGALLSVNEIVAHATTKKRLGQSSGALAVDMETYRIGQVAAKHHISFVGLRTIFDACDDDVSLPITQCMTPDGVLQPGRLLRDLIRQPSLLAQLLPLWRKARTAGHHLETWLYRFLTLLSPEG